MPANPVPKLTPESLHRPCNPTSFSFETTADLPDFANFIGQPRAYRGLEIGSEVTGRGFNIYVMGLPASGRTTLSREYLEQKASALPPPDDLCYINNFADPHQPKALHLPPGRGVAFRKDMEMLITRVGQEIQKAFSSGEYTKEVSRLAESLQKSREASLSRLQAYAAKYNFLIAQAPMGFVLVPSQDGQPLKPEELEKLSSENLEKIKELEAKVGAEVKKTLEKVREMERAAQESLREIDTQTALFVVEHLVNTLREKYAGLEAVLNFLNVVQNDIVENVEPFRAESSPQGENVAAMREVWLKRYVVNVVVDNDHRKGAPVILESQPTYHNLVGRVEHEMVMGASRTDFTMIRPGALHRANGGYLILPIRELLINPYAWEGLKRCLHDGCIRIVERGSQLGLVSTTLEPEPVPLNVKVVLIGTPMLYYMLEQHDEDFPKLFKVRAEFASKMDRTSETEQEYALFIRSVTLANQLSPFERSAVARIIEHGSRMVENQNKLSTRFGKISDLVREAEYWARKSDQTFVTAEHVQRAIDENIYRSNLLEEQIQELIVEDTLMVDVAGTAIGQINALSVLTLGDYAFGRPSRVTATAQPGRGGVLDLERKAELGGPIHTKGVMIINGFLGGRYGREKPLTLSASLTFEQSYDGVEGDSASAAELFALLSAITGIPLRQELAITGSMNQHGLIQPIGGVNEKVEGFFAVCKEKGLTGTQGVVIPASNVKNLMLRSEVVQAVTEGQFHLWAIKTVDEGLEIFTDIRAGARGEDDTYPDGSFNRMVVEKLDAFAEAAKEQKAVEEDK